MHNQALDEGKKERKKMRKIQILGAAFFAVLAFGVVSAASAVAAPKWLVNGAETNATHSTVEGKFLFLGLSLKGTVVTHIECNGVLLGTIGPIGADLVEKVFGLKGEAETEINCEVLHGVGHEELGECAGSLLAQLSAENLPWKTELLLPAGTTEIVDHFLKEPGAVNDPAFLLLCTNGSGLPVKVLCLAKTILTKALTNIPGGGVLGLILNELSDSCPLQDPLNVELVAHITAHGEVKSLAGAVSVSD